MDIDPLPATALLAQISHIDFGVGQIVALSIAVLALIISGFISGSEIAYFSLTPSQLEDLDNTPKGASVRKLLSTPENLLATILIANNTINVTIVILCNFALGPIFENLGDLLSFILQTIILTFLILLFGEILPKLYANNYNLKWAKFASGGIMFFMKIFFPLSSMLVKSSSIVNKVVTKKSQVLSTDELSQALEITDVKADEEKEMLKEILKFGNKTVEEVMTPRVDITDIDIDSTFDEVMDIVISSGYSRLPVYKETQDNIKGVLYSRDLLPYIGKDVDSFQWQSLIREPYYVPESRMIDDLLEDFRKLKIHLAIVVDEFGGTQGIVTLEDILEEIVGDINDEYDEEEINYKRLPDDTFIFEGKTLLSDFFKITQLNEDDYAEITEDAETLAGMLLTLKGDFPKEKEPLVFGRCRFLILEINHHRIASVRVKVMPKEQA